VRAADWWRCRQRDRFSLDVTASAFLTDGTEVKIVTGEDDHSRFCVIAKAAHRAGDRPPGVPGARRRDAHLRNDARASDATRLAFTWPTNPRQASGENRSTVVELM